MGANVQSIKIYLIVFLLFYQLKKKPHCVFME